MSGKNDFDWMGFAVVVIILALILLAGVGMYFRHIERLAEINYGAIQEGGAK